MDADSDRPDKLHQSEGFSAQRGRLSFGYFALAAQRKVTRQLGEKLLLHFSQTLHPCRAAKPEQKPTTIRNREVKSRVTT